MHALLRHRLALIVGVVGGVSLALLAAAPPASALFGCGVDPVCMFGKGAGAAVSSVAGDAITALAKSVLQALGHAVEWSATLWTGVGTPQLADTNGQPVGAVAFVQQNLLYFTAGYGGRERAGGRGEDRDRGAEGVSRPSAHAVPGGVRDDRGGKRSARVGAGVRQRPDGGRI